VEVYGGEQWTAKAKPLPPVKDMEGKGPARGESRMGGARASRRRSFFIRHGFGIDGRVFGGTTMGREVGRNVLIKRFVKKILPWVTLFFVTRGKKPRGFGGQVFGILGSDEDFGRVSKLNCKT